MRTNNFSKINLLYRLILTVILGLLLSSCSEKEEKIDIAINSKIESTNNEGVEKLGKNHNQIASKKNEQYVFGRTLTDIDDDMVIGKQDAPVTIIEYFSPTCPYCVYYHKKTYPKIKEKYIDTGKVKYVMREFIGTKQDLDASILARCSDDLDIYLKFVNVILHNQKSWAYSRNYREILTNIGIMGGITAEQYASCLNDQSKLKTVTDNTKLLSRQANFRGTPAFFINGKIFSPPYSVKKLSQTIESAIKETTSAAIN